MKLAFATLAILLLGFFAPLVLVCNATIVRLNPSDDSWIDYQFPDTTYGWQDLIHVMRGSTIRRSYLKFDLSSVPPEKVLTAVRLYLYCVADDSYSVTVNVHETTDNWDEVNLTWNTAPMVGAFISNTTVGEKFQYYSWDLTSVAQIQYQGDKKLSVVLKPPQDEPSGLPYVPQYHRDFRSKETSGDLYDPYLEIEYETAQYYLTIVSPFGSPGGAGWYYSGDTAYATLDTGVVDCGNGTRRVFTFWNGDASGTDYAQSNPILMDGAKTGIANWKTQHYLALQTDPINVAIPSGEGWHDEGTHALITVEAIVDIQPGKSRYAFSGWKTANMYEIADPSSPSTTVLIDEPKTTTANYTTQHYLVVTASPVGIVSIVGEGWYNESSDVTLVAPHVTGYNFVDWNVDGASQGFGVKSTSIVMNSHHTATATYTEAGIIGGETRSISAPLLPSWIVLNLLLAASVIAKALLKKEALPAPTLVLN